ncbi:MAG: hypothetical protein Q9227_008920 [Pyrenula ochraceoflavens]
MTSFNPVDKASPLNQALEKVIALMSKWAIELEKGKAPQNDVFNLERFGGTSQHNDPAIEWDPKSLESYFILHPESDVNVNVALGNVFESHNDPFQTITTKSEVLVTSDQSTDFGASHRITNSYKSWQTLVSPSFKGNEFQQIVREEWSRPRALEYLKIASQTKELKARLMTTNSHFYLITGILYGVTATHPSKVVGYKVSRVSLELHEEGDQSSFETSEVTLVVKEEKVWSLPEFTESLSETAGGPSLQRAEDPAWQRVEKEQPKIMEKDRPAERSRNPIKSFRRQVAQAPGRIKAAADFLTSVVERV